jgi:predicted nucleic acid-binding protein
VNLVDSSAWLEYFADGPQADAFAKVIEAVDRLIVPTVVLLEVARRVRQQRDDATALIVVSQMRRARVVDLDADLAVTAGLLGVRAKLPLADSIILATARLTEATIWTMDADFDGMENVRYFPKLRA